MADQKISAMTVATDLVAATIPIVQGGNNKQADISLFVIASGLDTQVQYNNSGVLGASSNFVYSSGALKVVNPSATDISTRIQGGIIYFDNLTGSSVFGLSSIPSAFGQAITVSAGTVNSGDANAGTTTLQGGNAYLFGNGDGGAVSLKTGNGYGTGVNGRLIISDGANRSMGLAILVASTITVNSNIVSALTRIFITCQAAGGTPGILYISSVVPGVSFTISSITGGTDTSTIAWLLVEPG